MCFKRASNACATAAAAFVVGAACMAEVRQSSPLAASAPAYADAREQQYLAESAAAMQAMMKAMSNSARGDADRDFVAQMIPHHQGAIAMAEALLRHGHDERLRRMAQEIIVTQQDEIAAMRLAVAQNFDSRPPPR